jgi:hypothetical protein
MTKLGRQTNFPKAICIANNSDLQNENRKSTAQLRRASAKMADDQVNGGALGETRTRQKRTREFESLARGGDGTIDADGNTTNNRNC